MTKSRKLKKKKKIDTCTSTPGGVSQDWSRGVESPPQTAGLVSFHAAQDTAGSPSCTLMGHVKLLIHQNPHSLHRNALIQVGFLTTSISK